MRFPRFRIRTLMTAVAVVGITLGLGQRWARFQRRAQYHRGQEQFYSAVAFLSEHRCGTGVDEDLITFERTPNGSWDLRPVSAEAEKTLREHAAQRAAQTEWYKQLAAYHDRLTREYTHSSTRPWIAVRDEGPPAEP